MLSLYSFMDILLLHSHIAKVRDKASMLSHDLLLFLEIYCEKCIKTAKRVNSLKLYSVGNSMTTKA